MIYILCPPYVKTGGTELAHQFVYEMNKIRDDVKIAYSISEDNKYLNPAFEKYVDEYVTENQIQDIDSNALILPEVRTLDIPKYKYIRLYIWWMSIDNYIRPKKLSWLYRQNGIKEVLGELKNRLTQKDYKNYPLDQMKTIKRHLVQSEYARLYLEKNGITNVCFLSDYINDKYIEKADEIDTRKKEDIVLFNPVKGKKFTKKVIKYCKDIKFIPIVGMTNEQVVDLMSRAKIYIDFGNHPGKDRIPREAATLKCCIITSMNGSAANCVDVNIPTKYKFECNSANLKNIKELIGQIFIDYDTCLDDFAEYRRIIKGEKACFEKQVIELSEQL